MDKLCSGTTTVYFNSTPTVWSGCGLRYGGRIMQGYPAVTIGREVDDSLVATFASQPQLQTTQPALTKSDNGGVKS